MQSEIANFGEKIFEKVSKVNGWAVSSEQVIVILHKWAFGHSQDGGIFAKSHALCSILDCS
jgi:hypothetical protein